MLDYTKKNINILAAFLTLLIIIILVCFFPNIFLHKENYYNLNENMQIAIKTNKRSTVNLQKEKIEIDAIYSKMVAEQKEKMQKQKMEKEKQEIKREIIGSNDGTWKIKIPTLGLDAPIAEGTSQDILAETVGHFEESNLWEGNVALAAHNRGYQCNFFQEIKDLKTGDIIIYQTQRGERKYKVVLNTVIKETNWSYIEDTEDNRITLITCEKDKREYRRCIQGIEIKT